MRPEISLFGKTRGTRVFVTINVCSQNISVLSTKSVKDMLTVLSSIGWLLSDLSFIGWLLLMRTCKLGQACPTVPQQISLSPQSGKAGLFPLSPSPVLFFPLQCRVFVGTERRDRIRVCSAPSFIMATARSFDLTAE